MSQHRRVRGKEIKKEEGEQSSSSEFKDVLKGVKKHKDSDKFGGKNKNNHAMLDSKPKDGEAEKQLKTGDKKTSKPITNLSISKYLADDHDSKEGGFPKLDSLNKLKTDEKKDGTVPPEIAVTQPIHKMACEKIENVQATVPAKVKPIITQMVSSIMVMSSKGVTTATVVLSEDAFKGTPFEGIEITLTNFDTANNAFNIELKGTAEQTALLNQNLLMLSKIMKDKQMPFQIGRVETSKKSDILFKRKASAGDKEGDTL